MKGSIRIWPCHENSNILVPSRFHGSIPSTATYLGDGHSRGSGATQPHATHQGQKQPCQFPASQGQTPVEATCCSTSALGGPDLNQDDRCDSSPDTWTTDTWSALTFQMNDEHYFIYSFDSFGTLSAAKFTTSAFGDLDCDNIQSTFQRIGWGDPQANYAECAMYGSPAFFVDSETE